MTKDKPEAGKQYRLTGGTGVKAISNGNTWAESVIHPKCRKCGLTQIAGSREATRDFVFYDICIGCSKLGYSSKQQVKI